MAISKPMLQPKARYVELVNSNDENYYEPIAGTVVNSVKEAQIESESLILELATVH